MHVHKKRKRIITMSTSSAAAFASDSVKRKQEDNDVEEKEERKKKRYENLPDNFREEKSRLQSAIRERSLDLMRIEGDMSDIRHEKAIETESIESARMLIMHSKKHLQKLRLREKKLQEKLNHSRVVYRAECAAQKEYMARFNPLEIAVFE